MPIMVRLDTRFNLEIRVSELNEKASPEIIITIVGNKIDLDSH